MIQIEYSYFSLITSLFTSVNSGGKQLTFKGLELCFMFSQLKHYLQFYFQPNVA